MNCHTLLAGATWGSIAPVLAQAGADNAGDGRWGPLYLIGVAAVLIAAFVLVIVLFSYGKLWLQAFMSNAHVSMFSLIGMSLRQVNAADDRRSEDHGHAGRRRHRSATRASPRGGSRPTTWPAATCRG